MAIGLKNKFTICAKKPQRTAKHSTYSCDFLLFCFCTISVGYCLFIKDGKLNFFQANFNLRKDHFTIIKDKKSNI